MSSRHTDRYAPAPPSASRSSKKNDSRYDDPRYDKMTSGMGKLSVRSAAPVAPRIDENAMLGMLAGLRFPAFRVAFPTWNLQSSAPKAASKSKYNCNCGKGFEHGKDIDAHLKKHTSHKVVVSKSSPAPKPAAKAKAKYNCDCGKGFDHSKDINAHLAKYRSHKKV